jgi:glycerate 2-kinase
MRSAAHAIVYGVLEEIYRETLARCAPERLVAKVWPRVIPSVARNLGEGWRADRATHPPRSLATLGMTPGAFPRTIVAIGKCAGALRDGVDCDDAFVAIPDGYRKPARPAQVVIGGHPHYTDASFAAGEALIAFVEAHDDITFLISGGGSACVELPLAPFTREEVMRENARLIASGLPIGEINAARKKMSAIKGGKLAQRVRGRCVTLVYSDVSSGALADVASGPTIPGSDEVHLIADNDTLTATAAEIAAERGLDVIRWRGQIESDVKSAARELAGAAAALQPNQIIVAGGEPTTVVHGEGRGGRCSELAVRFAIETADGWRLAAGGKEEWPAASRQPSAVHALFASSDGVDGNSGAAGVLLDRIPEVLDRDAIETELSHSNSMIVAQAIGRAIMIPPAGNNLRDLYLLARG